MTPRQLLRVADQIGEVLKKPNKCVYKSAELKAMLQENRTIWRLTPSVRMNSFIQFLQDQRLLAKIELSFPSRKEIRYLRPNGTIYELALTLRSRSYISHRSAMILHGLTYPWATDVYINHEQSIKPSHASELTQERLDQAFRNKSRISSNKAQHADTTIWVINGMHTGQLGVINLPGPNGESFPVTSLERTLMDITVRPVYSGGIPTVLNAYIIARDRISIDLLVALLRQLNYVYPYHQAVGFYLERAGVSDASLLAPLKEFGLRYDFYLGHDMQDTHYSKEWRLHYPANL
jgi:hypothetical protein